MTERLFEELKLFEGFVAKIVSFEKFNDAFEFFNSDIYDAFIQKRLNIYHYDILSDLVSKMYK